jgi:membrane protein implicated in regulation of membrane protease activity
VLKIQLLAGEIGSIRLAGDIWSCKNIGVTLHAGDTIIVTKVEGNKLFIMKTNLT